ncbi:uncharacterized protein si:ch73-173p19.1 isoform X2 [Callorhinchus milii]|uniref:uncharacterized protein si:ch73-173p19.1 isoform X2 n=1 Tax=Callorhinchus milii TaxID=7868 RepID=UPI001C3FE14E|nr:uncharacterized protein si:ch73-173p19.1 isoform X2 [Callorhinchus milii]
MEPRAAEMGFEERRAQAAVNAGIFNVQEATEWLLQGSDHNDQGQRKQAGGAMSAFNPPLGQAPTHRLALRVPPGPPAPAYRQQDPMLPVPRKLGKLQQFDEQQKAQQEIRTERRNKQKDHELALKRIADDRENLRAKSSPARLSERFLSRPLEGPVPGTPGGHSALMIRLPWGECIRERFPAETTLAGVRELVAQRCPHLPNFLLLQGLPRRRFSQADLSLTLRALGLHPSATLCVQPGDPTTDPSTIPSPTLCVQPREQPGDPPTLTAHRLNTDPDPSPGTDPRVPTIGGPRGRVLGLGAHSPRHHGGDDDNDERDREELLAVLGHHRRQPGPRPLAHTTHSWGKGQKLAAGLSCEEADDQDAPEEDDEDDEEDNLMALIPPDFDPGVFRMNGHRIRSGFEPQHQWPEQGNRLRPGAEDGHGGPQVPVAAGRAALERLQRGSREQLSPSQPTAPRPATTSAVPSLLTMATRGAITLITAPSRQYAGSLGSLPPRVAERLVMELVKKRWLRPRSLELFSGCSLGSLVLDCYPLTTNQLLLQLSAFPSLHHLSLASCRLLTDSGLESVSHLKKLQHLNLAACPRLTDRCLSSLTGLNCLSHLTLDQTKVTDCGMRDYLESAPSSLVHLSLNETAVSEGTLVCLPRALPHLRLLSIKHTQVTDVSALREVTALHTLCLDHTGVTESSLQTLGSHPNLSSISVSGLQSVSGDSVLHILSGLPLTQLKLPSRHTVSDAGLLALAGLHRLLELDLTDYSQATDQGLQCLASLTRLRRLSLSNTQVTDVGLMYLQPLSSLEELCLDRTRVSSKGVAQCVCGLPRLQVLGLAATLVGDSVVPRGLARCRQLIKLNLSRTRLTDTGLKKLRLWGLSQLSVEGTGVTEAGVTELLAACPNITSIRAGNLRPLALDQQSDEEA